MDAVATKELKVLILEDVATDAELVERALRKGGLRFTARRADSRAAFEAALTEFAPDLVLSDYNLPDINGLEALKIVRAHDPDLPVIVVTGALSDEDGSKLVREGARDYVLKDRLARLPFGVQRVLLEAEQDGARRRAEDALRRSEETFRNLVENSQEWIWEVDPDGVFTYSSPRAREFVGRRPDEVIGVKFLDFMPPDEAARVAPMFYGFVSEKKPFSLLEQRMIGPSGAEIIVEVSGVPVLNSDGSLKSIQGIARDVTEAKRLERERALQAAVMLAVQETSIDGILVVDPQTKIISYNQRFIDIWGVSAEEVARGRDEPILQRVTEMQSDPEAFLAGVRRLYQDTTATSRDELTLKDGRVMDRYSAPVRLQGGEYVGRVWFFRDVTEQKRAEQKIRDDEARFRGLVEQEIAGIYIVDADGRLAYVNPKFAETFGYDPAAAIGKPFSEFLAEADKAAVNRAFEGVLGGDIPSVQLSIALRRKDGALVDVLIHSARSTFEGRPATIGVILDITEQKRAEQKVREDEARFRGLVEQEIAGIYILRKDGAVAYINAGFAKMVGYTPEEVVGRSFLEFIAEPYREPLQRRFAAEIAGNPQPTQIDAAILRRDGTAMEVLAQSRMASYEGEPASIGIIIDVSEQRRAELDLRRVNRTLQTLSAGNEALVRAESEEELLQAMCRIVVERGGYRMAWIGVPQDDAARTIVPVASAGDTGGYLKSVTVSWSEKDPRGRGVMGAAVRTGQRQTSQDFATDRRTQPWRSEAEKQGFASSVAFPLKDGDKVFAVLALYAGEVDAFNEEELKLLQELANDIAYGVKALRVRAEREAAVQRWRASLVSTIGAIASTTEMRDPYTAGHQHRVAKLAVAIAEELKLPEDQIQGINLAGIIHDVGKITVPSELLTKPGKLSPLEFQLIQTHAQAGYDMVKGVDFPWPIAQAILQHHERLDGSGYPNGLHDNEIIHEAKILAVADVVEAMMSHRPYRPALGLDAALDEIQRAKGRLYDPAAVDACLRLFREKGFSLS